MSWRARELLAGSSPAIAVVLVLLVGIPLVLLALGLPTATALRALWMGSFGSGYALTSGTLVRAAPLILTGLSVALAFRAGIFNIGGEGQLLVGAAAASATGLALGAHLGRAGVVLEIAAGAGAGAAWAGIAALLRARFRVLEVISTILLNFIALNLVGYLVRGPLQEPLRIYPQSQALAPVLRLPRFSATTRLHAGILFAVATAFALWWFLRYSAAGFRARAAGANPDAARVAGEIDVMKTTTRAFLVSGALAGAAGAIELTGVTFALYENVAAGYGYTGIAVALLARLHPLGVLGSALVFGALESGATAMQRDAGVPSVIVSIAEAMIILALVTRWRPSIAFGRRAAATSPGASTALPNVEQ